MRHKSIKEVLYLLVDLVVVLQLLIVCEFKSKGKRFSVSRFCYLPKLLSLQKRKFWMSSLFVKFHQIFISLLLENLQTVEYEESILTPESLQGRLEIISAIHIPE